MSNRSPTVKVTFDEQVLEVHEREPLLVAHLDEFQFLIADLEAGRRQNENLL
jgi:hypothetical protein